ncbi:hypothetical protein [Loktanella sp. Alg231-35]|uniref:hypothetical protein n=1 Tax=Loktanella sp. Alg231-35 TaxID=1922220 RepID=UPI00131F2256|nr:hypothetical protein [Loktanella sp. Alg231-35]
MRDQVFEPDVAQDMIGELGKTPQFLAVPSISPINSHPMAQGHEKTGGCVDA